MIIPVLALALLGFDAAGVPDYVPDTGWTDDGWDPSFYEQWFGGQLRAMREPPLTTPSNLAGFRERLRFLVLPTFEPAYAYRVDVRTDGSAMLRWTRLSGRGGYAPGHPVRRGSRRLSPEETAQVSAALRAAALGSLPREHPFRTSNPDGTESFELCIDGTAFVFEHLDAQGRQFLLRNCDIKEEALQRLAATIFRLQSREQMG